MNNINGMTVLFARLHVAFHHPAVGTLKEAIDPKAPGSKVTGMTKIEGGVLLSAGARTFFMPDAAFQGMELDVKTK